MLRRWDPSLRSFLVAVSFCVFVPLLQAAQVESELRIEVDPLQGSIGDALDATLTVVLPTEADLETGPIGPTWGPFSVLEGDWIGPDLLDDAKRSWVWRGRIAAFEIGELELPSIAMRIDVGGSTDSIRSEPVAITIISVLDPESGDEPADLKDPASVKPNLVPLRIALALLALLLIGAGLLWWLQRRYAGRLAAVPVPDDPFHRVDPHVWVYRELQHLLDRRLPEQGQIDPFYAELSRILKLYLGGRFRVDLLERTTDEVPELLRQVDAPRAAASEARSLLEECDRVKFARDRPEATSWRRAVERVYSVVDITKPARPPEIDQGAA